MPRTAAGSSPTGPTCAPRSPRGGGSLGKTFHALASLWVVGPVQDTQCGFKGFRRDVARDVFARQKVTSIVFDVEVIFLVRRRGYSPRRSCPIRWADRRGSRMHPGLRLAIRVAWDLFRIPLLHRDVKRVVRGAERSARDLSRGAAMRLTAALERLLRPDRDRRLRPRPGPRPRVGRLDARLRLPRLPRGRRPGPRRGRPRTTRRSRAPAASACSTTRRPSSRSCCRSGCWRRDGDLDVDRRAGRGVRDRDGADAGVRADAVADRAAGGPVVAVPVRGQAGPGRADPVPAVRGRLARDPGAGRARRQRRARGRDQDPARPDPAVGVPHGADPGGRRTGVIVLVAPGGDRRRSSPAGGPGPTSCR